MSGTASEYPGWEANDLGTLRLTIIVAGEHITQATVTGDPGTGLCRTHIRALVTRQPARAARQQPGAGRAEGRGLPSTEAPEPSVKRLRFTGSYPQARETACG